MVRMCAALRNIPSLSDEMAEVDTTGHRWHGTGPFTVMNAECQAMRNDFSECIKKIRVLEETNDKFLANATESPKCMCSKTTEVQEQIHDKTNEWKELQLDVLRWKKREETHEYQ